MPPFPRPTPEYDYGLDAETEALARGMGERGVPRSSEGKLLVGTWNLANLGVQKRTDKDLRLMAALLSRFDLSAVQEVNDRFEAFEKLVGLPVPKSLKRG